MSAELAKKTHQPEGLAPLTGYAGQALEEIMINLCCAGKPRVSRMDDGWLCVVEMHVAAAGTEFKVKSEFDCGTPLEAARQCAERVIKTLSQWT